MSTNKPRIVKPRHNNPMGYEYRARIESQYLRCGFLWLKYERRFRYVIERNFVGWDDFGFGPWVKTQTRAKSAASHRLDMIEGKHVNEDITKETYL